MREKTGWPAAILGGMITSSVVSLIIIIVAWLLLDDLSIKSLTAIMGIGAALGILLAGIFKIKDDRIQN